MRNALVLVLALASCNDRPRPWDAPPDASARAASARAGERPNPSEPFLSKSPALGGGGALELPAVGPEKIGKLWASCHAGFEPGEEPLRDVVRLGLSCGPANGMERLGVSHAGELRAGAPARHDFPARAGECFRVFAEAALPTDDLAVEVRSSRGSRLARDASHGRLVILEPRRPFCSFGDDTFTVELRGDAPLARGAARYALEVWRLAPSR